MMIPTMRAATIDVAPKLNATAISHEISGPHKELGAVENSPRA